MIVVECSELPRLRSLWFLSFQAEDGIRDWSVTGVQTCALPICSSSSHKDNGRATGLGQSHQSTGNPRMASAGCLFWCIDTTNVSRALIFLGGDSRLFPLISFTLAATSITSPATPLASCRTSATYF